MNRNFLSFIQDKLLIENFQKFKKEVEQFLNKVEEQIHFFIRQNEQDIKKESIYISTKENDLCATVMKFQNYFQIIQNELQYTEQFNNLQVQSCIFKKNTSEFQQNLKYFYSEVQTVLSSYFKNPFDKVLYDNKKHNQIQIVNSKCIRRNTPHNDSWYIQVIKFQPNETFPLLNKFRFRLNGNNILFGITSEDRLSKAKYQISKTAHNIIFIKMDGTLNGLKADQEQFDFQSGDIISLTYKMNNEYSFIIENETKNLKKPFIISKIKNWCLFLGLGDQSDEITLID